jgi:hypothetical protein
MVMDIAQIIGAVFVLVAFAALQFGRWRPDGWFYLVANVVGSATLAVVAAFGGDPGFLLLEGVWSLVTLWSLVEKLRGRPVAGAH